MAIVQRFRPFFVWYASQRLDGLRRLFIAFWSSDTRAIRFEQALASLMLGVFIAMPGNMLDDSIFRLMEAIAPEWLWALGFVAHGLAGFALLTSPTPRRWLLICVSLFGFVIWLTSLVCVLPSAWPFPPVAGEIVITAAGGWLLMRAVADGR